MSDQINIADNWNIIPIPEESNDHKHFKHGFGKHVIPSRKLLGSINISAKSDSYRTGSITHLDIEGTSQWVIGQIVTRKENIEPIGLNSISFMLRNVKDYISLINDKFLSYIPYGRFFQSNKSESVLSCLYGTVLKQNSWKTTK